MTMKKTVLKSKLHKVVVTQANVDYHGSITLDRDLMDAMGVCEFEKVEVNGATTDSRISTYVIEGKRGSGIVGMNGGAARHFIVGDEIHVLAFWIIDEDKRPDVIIVETDNLNRIINTDLR